MYVSILYLAVLAASWVKGGEAYKCDQKIIASIKHFNKKAPSHVLDTVRIHFFVQSLTLQVE